MSSVRTRVDTQIRELQSSAQRIQGEVRIGRAGLAAAGQKPEPVLRLMLWSGIDDCCAEPAAVERA